MRTITLRELSEATGASRRAIQGYEKEGLVKASGKNRYGHLLYDETAQNRVYQIKLYQKFGFKVKEIKSLMDAPNHVVKDALEAQLNIMEQERNEMDSLIRKIQELINTL
jgi:DNA-binding transcriptional MerR regulator